MRHETVITVGILSDSHRSAPDATFQQQCGKAFAGCEVIIHAGDLTDISVLQPFAGKVVHAVHGNTCNRTTRLLLPERLHLVLGGYRLGVAHGAGSRHDITERILADFPEAACIIFGHSHLPSCQRIGGTLCINPGSFQDTGRYGAPGTYAILRISGEGLAAAIHSLPQPHA